MRTRLTSVCICMALCLVIAMGFAGCGKGAGKDLTPTQTVEVFLDAFKAQDEETMNKVYAGEGNDFMSAYESGDRDSELTRTMQDELMTKWRDFDYKVTDEKIAKDGKTAEVTISITTYNMVDVFNNFYQEYMSQALDQFSGNSNNLKPEDYEKLGAKILKEEIDKCTEKDYTSEATLPLTLTDGQWIVDKIDEENEDFLNAITGGMMTVLQEIVHTQGLDEESGKDSGDETKTPKETKKADKDEEK